MLIMSRGKKLPTGNSNCNSPGMDFMEHFAVVSSGNSSFSFLDLLRIMKLLLFLFLYTRPLSQFWVGSVKAKAWNLNSFRPWDHNSLYQLVNQPLVAYLASYF